MNTLKRCTAAIILLLTVVFFYAYIRNHPEVIRQLRSTSVVTLVAIISLYALTLITLSYIHRYTLEMCGKNLQRSENLLLTAYSSLVNFFGPLQSGPGFRAVYLKKKHSVSIKKYAQASLVYYAWLAAISGVFVLMAFRPIIVLMTLVVIGFVLLFAAVSNSKFIIKIKTTLSSNPIEKVAKIGLFTAIQILLLSGIYLIELRSVTSGITYLQALTYTGVANFSLFVSLTPGALGIRESFLFISQQLHNIPGSKIITANVLDRAVYVLFLGLVFVSVILLNGRTRLKTDK